MFLKKTENLHFDNELDINIKSKHLEKNDCVLDMRLLNC